MRLAQQRCFEDQIDLVQAELQQFREQDEDARRIVIFIHGGLNTLAGTNARSHAITCDIMESGAYPIFIGWNSSFASTYRDHLFWIRRGNDFSYLGALLSPFVLAADVVNGVIESPISLAIHGYRVIGEGMRVHGVGLDGARAARDSNPQVTVGDFDESKHIRVQPLVLGLITLPLRVVATPFMRGIGPPAWEMMQRRIRLMIEPEAESHAGRPRAHPKGMTRFFESLAEFQDREEANGRSWEIDVVGHSMGSMVINELLHQELSRGRHLPEFRRIAYLAPACSVLEFEQSVLPYLRAHDHTEAFVLTLPFQGDVMELWANGSLLLWIDDNFAHPVSEIDHTLGRLPNVLLGLHRIPEDLQPRVFVRPSGDTSPGAYAPQTHGAFSQDGFWDPANWRPD